MRCVLIGEKLAHSFSEELHAKLGLYEYGLKELAPDGLAAFMKARDFDGLNVTIPYKQAVIPFLDELSDGARAVGAVNTVVKRGDKLIGHNTDIGGMEALLRHMDADIKGKTVLIAGSGGTSLSAAEAARRLGAAKTVRLSRSGRNGAVSYETAYGLYSGAEILINATPAGMYPDVDSAAVEPERFRRLEAAADAVYNPLTTCLVRRARRCGAAAEGGLYMLASQAVLSAELFTGGSLGADTAEKLYRELLFEKRAIVLVGMPGSGKTTVGALLAEKLGRSFTDTDAEAARRAGMSIPDIFRTRGEKEFREIESRVIKELSLTCGGVIATGGGAVLRRENVDALKMNGTLVFLDRPENELLPTADRPLADDAEKLRALYKERYPLYLAAADAVVRTGADPRETAERIAEILK
jgi:shikimate dehydrogenase